MRLITLATLAACLVSSTSAFTCGSNPGSREQVAHQEQEFHALLSKQADSNDANGNSTLTKRAVVVGVFWNIIYDGNTGEAGYPDSVITQTINIANNYFSQIGLSFQIRGVRRIPQPYNVVHGVAIGNNVDRGIKNQYRQGGVESLNIYTYATNPNFPYAGYSSFPKDYNSDPKLDGIIYDYNYLPIPGRQFNGANSGSIMTHEIGHWVGLYHTFQDGCTSPNDYVDDTPAEGSAASGCPTGRDTCTQFAGVDPIHNMMDYTNDNCRTGFTGGQFTRLRQQMSIYRGINI